MVEQGESDTFCPDDDWIGGFFRRPSSFRSGETSCFFSSHTSEQQFAVKGHDSNEQTGRIYYFFFFTLCLVSWRPSDNFLQVGRSRTRAIDFDDIFGHVDKLVDEALSVHFGQYSSLIIVPARHTKVKDNVVRKTGLMVSMHVKRAVR